MSIYIYVNLCQPIGRDSAKNVDFPQLVDRP